jgi:hypothetical protein
VVNERGIGLMDFFWELAILAAFALFAFVIARSEGYLIF